jgi:two-component system phosphate regulon sensor histidine kinase PhoR
MNKDWKEVISYVPTSGDHRIDWEGLEKTPLSAMFEKMMGIQQNPEHHGEGNVYLHTRSVCENLVKLDGYRELAPRDKQILFVSALLHDIGKIRCTRTEDGVIVSPHHASSGAITAREMLWRDFGVCGDKDLQSFREAVRAALSGNVGYDFIKKGERFYSVHATPVMHNKSVDGAVIVILDVTEKEERDALRREFTSNVSHELKTPLTSISGFAELIKSGMAEGEDARRFAENIHKESSRLISLVGDIIRLSQLDGSEIPYDDEPVDLYSIAEDVVERLLTIAEKKNVTIELSGEETFVLGNALIIEEMIYNLCDNGIKYNRDGGHVKIDVRTENGFPTFSVSDSGIGIPKDMQERVFERFYRVDKSHSRSIGGTGLGLSIVKHAASYHKADIRLESEEGVGTSVTVTFPINIPGNKE